MKRLRKTVLILLSLILALLLLLAFPRLWSALNPEKPPVGYHFMAPAYAALFLGLEELIVKTPEVPEGIREIRNIEYKNVDGKSLQLDLYIPDSLRQPAPLLVFIHGGGWKGGKRSDYLVYLVSYARKGYITGTVSYRLLKDAPYPACVKDVADAVEWLFKNGGNYGYDPERIALIGGSAGAHLAMLTAYGWKQEREKAVVDSLPGNYRIRAVVDIYGPADLTTEYARTQPLVTHFIGRSWEEAPGLYREASPLAYIDGQDPPTLILHGTSDKLVPVSQSDTLKARLETSGVPVVCRKLPLWPHTMDMVKRVNDYCQIAMDEFFETHLK